MEINLQIANWLVAVLGGLASWVVVAACALLALNIYFRARLLIHRAEGVHWLLDRSLVIRFLCLLFFIWVLIGFNSNAPKLVLDPDYSAERRATEEARTKETAPVEDASPERETAAETAERLREMREAQREEVLGGE